ncbi:MAG: biotin transporter BioY [Timaviella obliquedivisa GSE-PSE-MK23-08B]|jgi:biotin transport system substrate-specific component|nr:biotin transporter BioY [Timaviella obliquedivisa GSE-PSE-MK23-08B]
MVRKLKTTIFQSLLPRLQPLSLPTLPAVKVPPAAEILWAIIGLILTIGGTLLEAFVPSPPWSWIQNGTVEAYSLGVTCQVGAVLLVGCLGGKNAAAISQVAYLLLGLTWFNVFTQGGGVDYVLNPRFGYLLGFIPGAWICGFLAFRLPVKLEHLALSCLMGLLSIHTVGMSYLAIANSFNWAVVGATSLPQSLLTYSLSPLPGQLAVICAVAVVSFALRHVMFY